MIIEELKQEEAKYRKLYESKDKSNYLLDGIKADVFKMTIDRIESKGLQDTYIFMKSRKDESLQHPFPTKLSTNLANAYGLVVGKLWKYYSKSLSTQATSKVVS